MTINKKAIIIYGSPRRTKSASYHLGKNFIKGLQRGGFEVEEIILANQKIHHCIGCYTCWTKTPGKCIHNDDMDALRLKLRNASLTIYATPLYIFSVPGIVKDFLDRQLPEVEPYLIETNGITTHPYRYDSEGFQRKLFLICVAGFPEQSHFDAVVQMFKKKVIPAGETYIGDILIGGSELMSKDNSQQSFKKLYEYVENAGYEVATNDKVSEKTINLIKEEYKFKPEELEAFRSTANKYWDSMIPRDYDNEEISISEVNIPLKLSDGRMEAFFAGMAMIYNPNVIKGLTGVFQFHLDDEMYYLAFDGNKCKAYKGSYPKPLTTIISPKDVWMKISNGELEGAQALMRGLYQVKGDMNLLMKMDEMFESPNKESPEKKVKKTPKAIISPINELKPLRISDGGINAYFAGMATQYNPNSIQDLQGVLQFNLDNEKHHLIIKSEKCSAYKGTHPNPILTVTSSKTNWFKISSGQIDGKQALLDNLYTVEGDTSILMNLDKLFSDKEESLVRTNIERLEKLEKVPDQRGPIKIKGSLWLTIAFIPWIVLWIFSNFISTALTRIIASIISIILILYHLSTNRPTLFEMGTCLYLVLSTIFHLVNWSFLITYALTIDYIFLGALWLGSLMLYFPLTSEYSRLDYPKILWVDESFLKTNRILTGVWGIYYLLSAILYLFIAFDTSISLIIVILANVLLAPLFIFTGWFQKWYPNQMLKK